jgi:hypothetical protein
VYPILSRTLVTLSVIIMCVRLASWSSGQSFLILNVRFRVRSPVLPWGIFLKGEDSHGDRGLGSLVELTFKVPPGTS